MCNAMQAVECSVVKCVYVYIVLLLFLPLLYAQTPPPPSLYTLPPPSLCSETLLQPSLHLQTAPTQYVFIVSL